VGRWGAPKGNPPARPTTGGRFLPAHRPPIDPDLLSRLVRLEETMRSTLQQMSNFNEDSRMVASRAFARRERELREKGIGPPEPGLVPPDEFRRVWAQLGVTVNAEEAAGLFHKYGCDKGGYLPVDVFVQTCFGSAQRLLAMSEVQRGPYKANADGIVADPGFRGKVLYRFCRRGVYTPTSWDPELANRSARLPRCGLALEHVHGYGGQQNTATNLWYNAEGRLVYMIAAVCVVLDKQENRQTFFTGHDDDVRCLCLHPARRLACSGQVASTTTPPTAIVWDTVTTEEVARIPFPRARGGASNHLVAAVAFSPCGTRLVVVTGDKDHTVHVYDWARPDGPRLLFSAPGRHGEPGQVFGCAWQPYPRGDWTGKAPRVSVGPYQFVTYGVKHLRLWTLTKDEPDAKDGRGVVYSCTQGTFGPNGVSNVMSATFLPDGTLAAGAASGDVMLFDVAGGSQGGVGSIIRVEKGAHRPGAKVVDPFNGKLVHGGVRAGVVRGGNTELVTGGGDGRLLVWDLVGTKGFSGPVRGIALDDPGAASPPGVRSLDAHPVTGDLAVGTSGCDVIEVVRSRGDEPVSLVDGSVGDISGVCWLPKRPTRFATASADGMVQIFCAAKRQLVAKVGLGLPATCVDFSPDGLTMAVGCIDGTLRVLDATDLRKTLVSVRHAAEAVHDLRYSPDGTRLAVACHDNFVYLYDAERNHARLAKCRGHSSYVTMLDWSADSQVLMTSSGAYEMLPFDRDTGRVTRDSQRDTSWATWTSCLGFPVMGLWRLGESDAFDGTDINSVCRSHRRLPRRQKVAASGGAEYDATAAAVSASGEADAAAAAARADPLAVAGEIVVTANDDGMVRLFNYPCVVENAPCREYRGHASHVAAVRISPDNLRVVSVGGRDRASFQWRVLPEAPEEPRSPMPVANFLFERASRILVADTVGIPAPGGVDPLVDSAAARRDRALAAGVEGSGPGGDRRSVAVGDANYVITVRTSDVRGAGTDANVFCVIYGPRGSTEELRLDNSKNNFERGREDVFRVRGRDVGVPDRLRIGHDSSGFGPGWHLDFVSVVNQADPTSVTFRCNKWLASNEGDGQTVRVLTPAGADGPVPRPHLIEVTTGDVRGAGTDANVDITLHGTEGTFGPHRLETSANDFERGRVDRFQVECLVGRVESLRIGHDGRGLGSAWHLRSLTVQPLGGDKLVFHHDGWLPAMSGGETHVTLVPTDGAVHVIDEWQCEVHTSDVRGAGTDARVTLSLIGGGDGKRVFGPVPLENSRNNFERGARDVFLLKVPRGALGPEGLAAIDIGHDGSGLASAWSIEQVLLTDTAAQKRYSFVADRWLDSAKPRCRLVVGESLGEGLATYRVVVVTSDLRGAGTDADVYIILKGDGRIPLPGGKTAKAHSRVSQKLKLDNSKNNFERAARDTFLLKRVPSVGTLKSIAIGHDGRGIGAGWHLDHVEVMCESDGSERSLYFDCRKWLDKSEGDGKIERELVVAEGPVEGGDGARGVYRLAVRTSDVKGAGTNANVHCELFGRAAPPEGSPQGTLGEATSSGRQALSSSKNDFERGSEGGYTIVCAPLGKLERIWIGHDGAGLFAGWHLETVTVTCADSGDVVSFPCHQWLDPGEPPLFAADVVLFPAGSDGAAASAPDRFRVTVHTEDKRGAGTSAGVSVTLIGNQGRSRAIELDGGPGAFERGRSDAFVIEAGPLGKLHQIDIGHDGRGIGSDWGLSHVEVENLTTGDDRRTFFCGKVLGAKGGARVTLDPLPAGDNSALAEAAAASGPRKYQVRVKTSDKRGAGTDKDITLVLAFNLTGPDSSSGRAETVEIPLESSANDFERDAMDQFLIDVDPVKLVPPIEPAVFAKYASLIAVTIGFASQGGGSALGAAWDLDYVEVSDLATGEASFFSFFARIDASTPRRTVIESSAAAKAIDSAGTVAADSGPISSANLQGTGSEAAGAAAAAVTSYRVIVHTGDAHGAGTDANVFLTLYGVRPDGTTTVSERKRLDGSGNNFERGAADNFTLRLGATDGVGPLGRLVRAEVSSDGRGLGGAWLLDSVEVVDLDDNAHSYSFPCGAWLDPNHDPESMTQVLPVDAPVELVDADGDGVPDTSAESATVTYTVTVHTAGDSGSGTDSAVSLFLGGERGVIFSGRPLPNTDGDRFERNARSVFHLEGPDMGAITVAKLAHGERRRQKQRGCCRRLHLHPPNTRRPTPNTSPTLHRRRWHRPIFRLEGRRDRGRAPRRRSRGNQLPAACRQELLFRASERGRELARHRRWPR